MKAYNRVHFLTPDGIQVTRRIEKGLTVIFENKPAAADYASRTRSYFYDLYTLCNRKRSFYGYAVPK